MTVTMGFIGFGKSTNRYHLPYLLIRENMRVKTIYNRRRKPEWEEEYQGSEIYFTDQLDELLDDPEIQFVSITTPPASHYEFAKRCLEKGKHVLVEKPFVTNLVEAEELLKLAKKKGLVCMPFQNRRFDSDFLTVKEVLANDWLGELVEIESHFDRDRPEDSDAPGEYYDGAFYGLGVHMLDQVISLFGVPDSVTYDIRTLRNKRNPDDAFEVQLFYGNLKIILKMSHLVKVPTPKFILHGKKGSFLKYGIDQQEDHLKAGMMPGDEGFGLDPVESYGRVAYDDENGTRQEETVPTVLGDYGQVYDFMYEAIVNGEDKLVSDEDILTTMRILEEAFNSPNPKIVSFKD
ncbi:oxidoreductase [Jeotgalibaca caeni]|uniref:oxidoreductase n=1 Tax=Jeotgalibaca caeni TaxID=3028623 RepID=UPI00237D92D3|nr:oxidoreductase [Jeotgalibaca caeni]MDE1549460.1 oxidoreductase [Jeotgalibaca caeni]